MQMDTTRMTAVSIGWQIRAEEAAAVAVLQQEPDLKPKALIEVMFIYLPLNLWILYLIQGHLSTDQILP